MLITYRQHQDTRDGKIYQCVLMPDGKWWSAENLAWDGAGYYLDNNPANGPIYGKLYEYPDVPLIAPPGAHSATRDDWLGLKAAIPGTREAESLKANDPSWAPNIGTDAYGFKILPSGLHIMPANWTHNVAYFWCHNNQGGTAYEVRVYASYVDLVGPSSANPFFAMSVRFIVDVFNEPIPPTKIKGAFSGSGVKAYFTNHNTATLELPISAQTTTELTIDKDFISFWGPFLGNVRILVVDGEYISEWKDWNFNV